MITIEDVIGTIEHSVHDIIEMDFTLANIGVKGISLNDEQVHNYTKLSGYKIVYAYYNNMVDKETIQNVYEMCLGSLETLANYDELVGVVQSIKITFAAYQLANEIWADNTGETLLDELLEA